MEIFKPIIDVELLEFTKHIESLLKGMKYIFMYFYKNDFENFTDKLITRTEGILKKESLSVTLQILG